jgi:adenosyl cobinamide kinase/adenosyl cobinamide phosphate guanylyltransferase
MSKLVEAKENNEISIINPNEQKKPGKLKIENIELHEAKKKVEAKNLNEDFQWVLAVKKSDGKIVFDWLKSQDLVILDVVNAALVVLLQHTMEQAEMFNLEATSEEKEEAIYNYLAYTVIAIQNSVADTIKHLVPSVDLEKIYNKIADSKETIANFVMQQVVDNYKKMGIDIPLHEEDLDANKTTE